MSFTTFEFALFFAVCVIVYRLLGAKVRKYWLLAAACWFYWRAGGAWVFVLAGETAVSWLCALAAEKWPRRRRAWTALGVCLVLALLAGLKYSGLISRAFGGAGGIAVPVGLSFFSFAVAGYLFDVYRGKIKAEHSLADYAVFVSFFPALLAGPVGRARDFLPQLKEQRPFDAGKFKNGLFRFVWGLFKKLAAADTIGLLVNAAYADPAASTGADLAIAAVLYSMQIYFDFSAYTDMALGAASMLGFDLGENFDAPYLSRSVKDFWKRWHISLTGWFREYLYVPLGGNRKGSARTLVNVLIVFAVSGMWHGADVSFIIWGLLNGAYQVAGSLTQKGRARLRSRLGIREDSRLLAAWQGIVTFVLVTGAWIFFRADGAGQAVFIIKRILLTVRTGVSLSALAGMRRPALMAALLAVPCVWEDIRIRRGKRGFESGPFVFWGAAAALLLLTAVFGVYGEGFDPQQFVYFRF